MVQMTSIMATNLEEEFVVVIKFINQTNLE